MNAASRIAAAVSILMAVVLASCVPSPAPAAPDVSEPGLPPTPSAKPTIRPSMPAPQITDLTWDPDRHVVNVGVEPWPASWSPWAILVDGTAIPTGEEDGALAVRPNAPLEKPPDGLIIGALPWVSPLDKADFPCCGTLQFSVPDVGLTNGLKYNLGDYGCSTASARVCPLEWTVHDGDWIISGTQSELVDDAKLRQRGNIYVRDSATLTIRNSELMVERGDTPTIHVYIFVDPHANLIIEGSKVYPGPDNGGLTVVMNRGTTKIIDSPTSIHYFDMSDGATLEMENSTLIYEIGGLLQVTGGNTRVTDSTVGALGLWVPAGAHLEASGLTSGTLFEDWNVQDLIPEADYQLYLDNATVLKDDFAGELKHGPYERGWIFFLDPDSHVRLSDSELRKVFLEVPGGDVQFDSLRIGEPSSLHYRDIVLEDIVAMGEWPISSLNADVTITDSTYLFLQPSGSGSMRLVDSHMVEFIPRDFSGTMIFENATWSNAGEIIGNVGYHSRSNNFRMQGSLQIADDVRINLQWKNAQVTREFEVQVLDAGGAPVPQAVIRFGGREYTTDQDGLASFEVVFDETNYQKPTLLEAWTADGLIARREIDFFTQTPIRLSP